MNPPPLLENPAYTTATEPAHSSLGQTGTTVVVARTGRAGTRTRRRLGGRRTGDRAALAGAAAAALATSWLLFTQLTPACGALGFVVVTYLLFLLLYGLLVSFAESGPVVRDRIASTVIGSLSATVLAGLLFVVGFVFQRAPRALSHTNFWTHDLSAAGPLQPLSVGGMLHALVGTLEQIGLALALTVPLGMLCAVFLNEFTGRFTRTVRTVTEAMTALPSIVAGLFVYSTVILQLGFAKSGFAASLALSTVMLPIVVRAADVVLRLVPGGLKEASYALGAGKWHTVRYVILPTARPGLATAVILGTARGIGETAEVLLTAGYTTSLNADPFHGPQTSLPLMVFELVKAPSADLIERGFGAAAVLLILVLTLFSLARLVGGRAPGNLTRRQNRRRAARSRATAARYITRRAAAEPKDTTDAF